MASPVESQRRIRDLESPTNSLVKVFRRALEEGRTRDGWLGVEGPLLIAEALAAPRAVVQSVLVARSAAAAVSSLIARLPRDAELARVPDRLFRKIAQTETPQGIAALVEVRPEEFKSVLARQAPVLVVACGVQDPGNLGNMIRSAQALGAAGMLTLEETASPFNPKAVRASAGAIFRLPIFPGQNPGELFGRLRAAGFSIVAADRHSPASLAEADLRGPIALLIGNEAAGLRPEIAREANLLLSIPIRPETDSVNAATAASIFLYEAARQRGFQY